jgi:hypothetical protein
MAAACEIAEPEVSSGDRRLLVAASRRICQFLPGPTNAKCLAGRTAALLEHTAVSMTPKPAPDFQEVML